MDKQIFINLPVVNLQKSAEFYAALGFVMNPQFSDNQAKCMVWSDHIYVMILTHDKFKEFTQKPIYNPDSHISSLYSLALDSVDNVHKLMEKGLQAGGKEPNETRDLGFMIQRTLEDPDGHTWELFHMDFSKLPS